MNTQNGTALANTDYVPIINQLVTFPAGTTQEPVTVSLISIGGASKNLRSFSLTASDMTIGSALAPASLILNDSITLSGPSVPQIATLTESGTTATVTTISAQFLEQQ